ncbi:MAG: phosphoglucomutase [Candidatus Viridilinea halotolerans]|uniref:Phosphoglucomutase n=1 Tax=Candidatus Viridilinea halotolerans TaxID=2491704 RepID=A0A426U6Q8_9CHLR|nr:MAG: phosphoglucomutase [Candidatus Viridilinea halotolerans]
MIVPYRPYTLTWQAIYTEGFTLDQVRRRTATLADGLVSRGMSCLVAYDTRFMGALFARDVEAVLRMRGVRVTLAAAPTPLPAVHHALDQRVADCALYISACNRAYVYNGLTLLANNALGLTLEAHAELPPAAIFPPTGDLTPDQARDLRGPYLDALRAIVDLDLVRRNSLTIFVDAMNGTTAGMLPTLLGEGGQTRAIEINRDPDPLFGRSAPDPFATSLVRLKKLVRESDSHLGLAISADGTALALVDKHGEQLDPAETALLLAAYLARQYRQRGPLVIPAPAPDTPLAGLPRVGAWEESTGLRIEGLSDPALRLHELIFQERTPPLLGATTNGEVIIGRYALYPDAVLAGLLCAEMVARSGGDLRSLIEAQREQMTRVG